MAVKPASPRINISEIDKTAIVPAVGSSGGGFVGNFRWGPVHERTLIADETGLVTTFASPNDSNSVDFHSASYFLKYSQTLQVVREVGSGAQNAHSAITKLAGESAGNTILVENLKDWEDNISSSVGEGASKTSAGTWIAKYPGVLGDALTVSFCPAADSATNNHFTGWTYASNFDGAPGTSSYASSNGASNDEVHVVVIDRVRLLGDIGRDNLYIDFIGGLSHGRNYTIRLHTFLPCR